MLVRMFRRDKNYDWFVMFAKSENQELTSRSIDMPSGSPHAETRLVLEAGGVSSATVAPRAIPGTVGTIRKPSGPESRSVERAGYSSGNDATRGTPQ